MTAIAPPPESDQPRRRTLRAAHVLQSGHVIYWWAEIIAILAYYGIYTTIRNATSAHASTAFRHAKQVIHLERTLGIYHELGIHVWVRDIRPLIIACNYFYGSLHFVVTIGVGIFLFRKFPNDYPRLRNTLAIATGLALIGFYAYQLMPPRLLPGSYGYIDTLAKDPTFWSFNSGAVSKLSNQFAAMPSVHCCWAGWCACALVPRVKAVWAKVLAILYPFGTMFVIVSTANHYFLDAIGGFTILAIGYVVARLLTRAGVAPSPPTPRLVAVDGAPDPSERAPSVEATG
jgi:hypothetical protein